MDEPELLTHQRQVLRILHESVAETVRQEQEATKRGEAIAVKARDNAQTRTNHVQAWLEEAKGALNTGREALEQVNRAHLLEKRMMTPGLELRDDVRVELEQNAAIASRAATSVERNVQALRQRQSLRKDLISTVTFIVVVVVPALIAVVVLYLLSGRW